VCLKADNHEKAARLFEQAIKSFEQFKYLEMNVKESQRATFSNAWFNQGNLFAAQKQYDQAIKAFVIAISESPF
jgi:tetratricopeptide (TPR) repeat protein